MVVEKGGSEIQADCIYIALNTNTLHFLTFLITLSPMHVPWLVDIQDSIVKVTTNCALGISPEQKLDDKIKFILQNSRNLPQGST